MNQVNFLPDGYLETKFRRRSAVICATLLGVVIGGVIVMDLTFRVSIKQLRNQQAAVQTRCDSAFHAIEEINHMRAQQQAIARQAELTASLVAKLPRSSILSEIGRALPLGVTLQDLTLDAPDDPANPEAVVKLSGQAINDAMVRDLIAQLKRSKLFTHVARSTDDVADPKSHHFQLQMTLNSQATAAIDLPQARSETVFLNPE